jgi:hypothetical protein
MAKYEPEVAARIAQTIPADELAIELDALIDHLIELGVSLDTLRYAIEAGYFNTQNHPLFRFDEVTAWFDLGMPTAR